MIKVKGYSLLSSRTVIESQHGKDTVQKIIDSLPPEHQTIFSNPILSHAHYPLEAYVHWLEGELRFVYHGDEKALNRQFLAATEKALNGVYSMMQRFPSPMAAIHGMAAFNHLDGMVTEKVEIAPAQALFVYRGFQKRHAIYEIVLRNWWIAVVKRTGGKNPSFEPRIPISAGKDRAEYVVSWTE